MADCFEKESWDKIKDREPQGNIVIGVDYGYKRIVYKNLEKIDENNDRALKNLDYHLEKVAYLEQGYW